MTEQEISTTNSLSIKFSDTAIAEMKDQRKQFENFVKSQLHDNIDYGTLPNVKNPSLWKSGAEKLASLFQLGSRIVKSDRMIDIDKNFAMFAVTIELFHIPSGKAISQCEGICNSHESKYKERQKYIWKKENGRSVKIPDGPPAPTPVGDVLNTLTKMAQKRAYVGAVIVATKASDFFNHDLNEDEEDFRENNPNYDEEIKKQADVVINKSREQQTINEAQRAEKKAQEQAEINKPIAVDERQELGKQINFERVRLQWDTQALGSFIVKNFGKQAKELNINEMSLLVETLKREVK